MIFLHLKKHFASDREQPSILIFVYCAVPLGAYTGNSSRKDGQSDRPEQDFAYYTAFIHCMPPPLVSDHRVGGMLSIGSHSDGK